MATQKQRHLVYEMIAIIIACIFGALAIPELFNLHNSFTALAGLMLILVGLGWLIWFIVRAIRLENKP